MISIGKFSRITRVSVKTLRYYDKIGLLPPVEVDPYNGYRFFSPEQLPRLNRILALKDLGFSLDEIGTLLDESLTGEEMRGMLKMKRLQLEDELRDGQSKLDRVEARLKLIEQEDGSAGYDVIMKEVDDLKVASITDVILDYYDQKRLWEELFTYVDKQNGKRAGHSFSLYSCGADRYSFEDYTCKYDDNKARKMRFEVAIPISGELEPSDRVEVWDLPGSMVASTVHRGSYGGLAEAYLGAMTYLKDGRYSVVVPFREVYIVGADTSDDEEKYVTEVQFPVRDTE